MKLTGGRIVARALEDEGISFTFGIPGTHNIELYDALAESESVRPILVTDEQSAGFMADGAWRASGRMACANLVPGAGLTHCMSGIAEAFLDCVPMLVLGCGIRRDTDMAYQLHDVDQRAMVAPVTKAAYLPTEGAELYGLIRRACREARSGRPGPVFVEVPADLYLSRHDVGLPPRPGSRPEPRPHVALPGGDPDHEVDTFLLDQAARVLEAADRPLLYVGAGAAEATDEVLALAELLEAPVSTTFQGKGVFPESHPLFLWPGFGDAAPPFARTVARGCEATLAVGCRFGEVGTGSYGLEPPGPLVHVDVDPDVPGRNRRAEVGVVARARPFLGALLERLSDEQRPEDPELRRRIRDGHTAVWEEWLDEVGGEGVTPAHLLRSAQRLFGPEAVFTADSGNGTFLAMECLRLDAPGRFLAPVDYSCMGYAVPAAIGARLAAPDRPVVTLAGDGALLMTGLELLTAVEEGIGVVVLVLRDRELAQIAQFQSTALNRKVGSRLADYELEDLARGMGAPFLRMDHDDHVEETLRDADVLARAGEPVVVEVAIDYSRRTWFTRGVVRTALNRLPLGERMRFVGRAVKRRITG